MVYKATVKKDHNVFSLAVMDSFTRDARKLGDAGGMTQEEINNLVEVAPQLRDFNDVDEVFHSGVEIEVDSLSEMSSGDAEERIHHATIELSEKLRWGFFKLNEPEEAYLVLKTDNGQYLATWGPDFWEPGTKSKRWFFHQKVRFSDVYDAGEDA